MRAAESSVRSVSVRIVALALVFLFALPTQTLAASASLHLRELRDPSVLSVSSIPVSLDGIPRGATRVKLLSLYLRANCEEPITIKGIDVQLIGVGDSNDIKRAYLLSGVRRLSRGVRFSGSGNTVTLRPRQFFVPRCGSRRLDVAVDLAGDAAVGGRFGLMIASPDDLHMSADVLKGSFPLRAAVRGSTVTPDSQGQVEVRFLPLAGSLTAIRDEVVARILIKADNNAHQLLYSIALKNTGTAKDDDIRNLYISRRRGRKLTPVLTTMDGDRAVFKFMQPYFLRRGQQQLFRVYGTPWTRSKTVNFTLEEPSDLNAQATRRGLRGRHGPEQ